MERTAVLLDTDIGSDIDDAIALGYLLRKPECELVGVTTVTGDVGKRSALAEALCRAAGRPDIPVHSGARKSMLWGPGQPEVPQYEALKDPRPARRPEGTAVEFIRKTVRERPGEITLLSIGPFTNVALLFAIDPEIPSLLKGFVSMAGMFFEGRIPEWNCRVDCVSTAMAYNARVPGHLSVGLDVTTKCRMKAVEVRSRFTKPPLDVVRDMAEVWFRKGDTVTFHDPLAAAVIFRPDLCTYEDGVVEVTVSSDEKTQGDTPFRKGAGPHRVAKTVKPEEFFSEYFSVFN